MPDGARAVLVAAFDEASARAAVFAETVSLKDGARNVLLDSVSGNVQSFGMATNYIPSQDGQLDAWAVNFADIVDSDPTAVGLTTGDASTINAATGAFHTAYETTQNPATRTPVSIAAKDAAKASMLATVRPFAMFINGRAATTDAQRSSLGLTIRKLVPTPVPAPTSAPTLSLVSVLHGVATLGYRDPMTPTSKAKPFGAIGVQLYRSVGTVPATDPAQATFDSQVTKSPCVLNFDGGDAGKVCTVFARFVTRSGPAGVQQVGPWSAPLNFNVV